ncbi:MAG: phage portal protein [Clostridia bacterium]|nr:phage portal protein [Lentisphaeria bacterium]MBR0422960.1 phage portal protein [Clostridia bacterium]
MFELVKKLFRRSGAAPRRGQIRHFTAANYSRFTDWPLSYARIDASLRLDYITMTLRARDLAVNNEYVAGVLVNLTRNVIGAEGFTLQSKAANVKLRPEIERLWREYQSRVGGFVTFDEKQSGRDFDALVLRTLMIDGEVFIHLAFDASSKFGYRYEVVDSLQIDPLYNVEDCGNGEKIAMGIRLDRRGRELAYYIRETRYDYYMSGPRIEIPASEMIHIFRKNFPDQSRGYSNLAPIILNLNQMDGYKEAELVHARIQACTMAVWERNGQPTGGDFLDNSTDEKGEFVREMKPGIFPVAPEGYSAKFLQQSSPSNQFAAFWKVMLRSISNALGISYNKASGDYELVNYSSLREATLEDRASFEEAQRFLIENWKDFQFSDFTRALALRGYIPVGELDNCLRHRFFGRRFPWVDPAKELAAKEKEYDLLLTDPISELESRGQEPEELIERWKQWDAMVKKAGLPFMARPEAAPAQAAEPEEDTTPEDEVQE